MIGESNTDICYFHSNGTCKILFKSTGKAEICNGYRNKSQFPCSFMKTEDEYKRDYDKAVEKNRHLGNCDSCKYRKDKCQYFNKEKNNGKW